MKKQITLLLLSFLFVGMLSAQDRNCSTMDNLEYRKQQNPQLDARMQEIENQTRQYILQNGTPKSISGNVITIPVVVHVVYRTSQENISDAQIQSQLDVLNEDFRRTNADADNRWSQAVDTEIQFCLASIDPNGNATTGITRKSTTRTSWGTNDAIKSASQGGVDAWDTSQYLNMWVGNIGSGILGYAQFPGGNASTDGVVMSPQYFGSSAKGSGFYLSAPFDLGRTTTHEVGHYLNLRHIWGDGNCNVDDFVADTPTSDAPNYGCNPTHVSCSSTDMVQNYMDYSDDGCMNLFTAGQKARMRAVLDAGGIRRSLALSDKCSGTPPPPPTCDDGIQNGDETGVDCGGTSCAPCQSSCSENEVTLTITFDNYPEETSWSLVTDGGTTVASNGYSAANPDGSTVTETLCLPNDCYTFVINDAYGDGICCSYGNGSYTLTGPDGVIKSGGSFGNSETTDFCLGSTPPPGPTCDDGIQNGDETGVDCGGTFCAPCQTGTTVLHEGYFETGLDGWQDGGSDCFRYNGSFSFEGIYSIRLRDNSGTASAMTSEAFDLRGFDQVEFNFFFYPNSMETGEDFFIRYFDGSSWSTIASYASGSSFTNGNFYTATVTLSSSQVNFASNARFRVQCDASNNSDQVYIDQVTITGIAGTTRTKADGVQLLRTGPPSATNGDTLITPTLTRGDITVNLASFNLKSSYRILNLLGQTVKEGNLKDGRLNVSELKAGVYMLEVQDEEETIIQKFVKQ
ncbi:putative secreted protein (Por secretion system target) [Kordia periserrulae]|uniref:Putative secreted protein (Por secretion system target) n=1 Tax=Kordia periserrulae TaxID=701523 RepID=A0A2T6BWA6_9FLAO|nr:M43 family zinc metalloprotease [Kordia periserrulae]PTX60362.1 putative secreted protein (Por secretion system target) [Kordia periserrulae]